MEIRQTSLTERLDAYPPFDQYFSGHSMGVVDIETTGLSPEYSQVILIGLLFPEPSGKGWIMRQYFAQDPEEERALLAAFHRDYRDLDFVVTYNGRSFDLPFLRRRTDHLGLPSMALRYNLDLYKLVKDFSDIGMFTPNLKQKTLENFMGLWTSRSDMISGGESVSLYMDYLTTGNVHLKEKILLHNRDDVLQLYRLLGVLSRVDLHRAMCTGGFPLLLGRERYIIQRIDLKKDQLLVEGVQVDSPANYAYFGEELPPFRFSEDGFSFSIPTLSHKDLTLVDGSKMDIVTDNTLAGYSVIKKGEELQYSEINLLVRLWLERIVTRWITEK